MIIPLDYTGHKKLIIDVIDIYCDCTCSTMQYCLENKLSIGDRLRVCGSCRINDFKKWIGYTNKTDKTTLAQMIKKDKSNGTES